MSAKPTLEPSNDNFHNADIGEIYLETKDMVGFPNLPHDPKMLSVELFNNSDLPATKIKMKYSVVFYKTIPTFDSEGTAVSHSYIEYKEIKSVLNFDYLASHDSYLVKIMRVSGEFSRIDIVVKTLKSKERTFIRQSLRIYRYEHPAFESLQDSYDYRLLLGVSPNLHGEEHREE
ncbi:hypothetical protein [Jeotgalibacillus proteolyticus]|uniref:hypothetical protein n=1 Tax=Jeotgalibacillus proteolyticus TaxID=2082395 RepID=UPI0010743AD6|nr:hypothetical protein [Jeotgalibacillus proteolyticus]